MQAAPAGVSRSLAVVRIGDAWVLLNGGRRWGRFCTHGQALTAAVRLRCQARALLRPLDILDQAPWGEMVPIDATIASLRLQA